MYKLWDLSLTNMLQIFVGLNIVIGTLSVAVADSAGLRAQDLQTLDNNHIIAKRQGEVPSPGPDHINPSLESAGKRNLFGTDRPIPSEVAHIKDITAFKIDIGPAELPIPKAKHMTLWYNGPEFPKISVRLMYLFLLRAC
jgi:hypothetical protein